VPEGHTIHRLAADLDALLTGRELRASSPQGRFTGGAALLDGSTAAGTDAYGKHLFVRTDGTPQDGRWLHVHLGLYGRFEISEQPAAPARGAVRLRLVTETHCVDLRGPTACELFSPAEKAAVHARLGPDPLRRDARPAVAYARIARSRTPIGALLMDQAVVAGIGNVYRAEILFRSGISPFREGNRLAPGEWEVLWADLRRLMRAGVRAGHILTTRSEHRPRRRGGVLVEDRFYVYRRTGLPCRLCGTPVQTQEMATRNLYWCPVCQSA
jgi:DNA-formamidopyrimidine glycosylase